MVRRFVLVVVSALTLLTIGAGTAQAWDLIADKTGSGRTTLWAWTRNYNQAAYIVDHAGTRISVKVEVECRNGDTFSDSWVDGGERFRFILSGLGNSGRCDHMLRVVPRKNDVAMTLAVWARG